MRSIIFALSEKDITEKVGHNDFGSCTIFSMYG